MTPRPTLWRLGWRPADAARSAPSPRSLSGTSRGSGGCSTGWDRSRSSAPPGTPRRWPMPSKRCAPVPASASSRRARSRSAARCARSGIGRLALEVPEARLVCATVQGCPDLARFPKRPRIRVRFFEPASGQTDPSESPADLSQRLLDEIRAIAPPVDAGRDPQKTLETYERKLAEREAAAAKRRADAADKERV